jgi:hypothetical protein
VDAQRCDVVHEHDLESGLHTLHVRDPLPPPPTRWSLIVGDCVHNLRSALDHLVYQLVIASGVTPKERNNLQFPICFKPSQWETNGGSKLLGMKPEWQRAVENLQPHKRRNEPTIAGQHPLEVIATLDNTDKHRELHLAAVASAMLTESGAKVTALDAIKGIQMVFHNHVGLPIEQAQLYGIIVTPPTAKVQIELQHPIPIGVAFGQRHAVRADQLDVLVDEVVRIVGRFEVAFA